MSCPSVLDSDHAQLEDEVVEYLTQHGYIVPPAVTYHEQWDEQTQGMLATRGSATSLYLRTRADRVAVHKTAPIEFEFELKAIKGTKTNLAAEALPMLHHVQKARLGVLCLYCFRVVSTGRNYGLWVNADTIKHMRKVFIPDNANMDDLDDFQVRCQEILPQADIIRLRGTRGGSNDPFIVISEEVATQHLRHWKDEILDAAGH